MTPEEPTLRRVAEQYEKDGYEVHLRPSGSSLPPFLRDFQPDLIAHRADEHVVIEIRAKTDLATDHELRYVVSQVNAQSGWRFDLVVGGSDEWPDEVTTEATERDANGIRFLTASTRRLLDLGQVEAAYLIVWSATEAALRQLARAHGVRLERNYPQFVAKTLYAQGLLSHTEYKRIQEAMRVRNALAHGLSVQGVTTAGPLFLLDLTEKLLQDGSVRDEVTLGSP
jgi:uncharacterized protein YutE (UPF0331/DUF86 family)